MDERLEVGQKEERKRNRLRQEVDTNLIIQTIIKLYFLYFSFALFCALQHKKIWDQMFHLRKYRDPKFLKYNNWNANHS